MALKKIKIWKSLPAEYWMIVSNEWDKRVDGCSCILGLYLNRQAREDSLLNVLETRRFNFSGNLTIADMYQAIKAEVGSTRQDEESGEIFIESGFFADAEDV